MPGRGRGNSPGTAREFALNLLPISAALVQATAGRPAGPLTVQLLPNARVAVSAAGWPPGRLTGRVLVADATRAPGGEPLQRSGQEAEALVRQYVHRRLCDATTETVLPALDTASLVHFFCHGRADLADPLSSGLRLMDGWMTVRTMFSRRPLRQQLVILSACESQLGGQAAPDEGIGLPAALFPAGAAGVIASQWKVSEQAALLIMRKFYDQLDAGAPPARALTTAQNWLRTATKDELIASISKPVHRRTPGTGAETARRSGRAAALRQPGALGGVHLHRHLTSNGGTTMGYVLLHADLTGLDDEAADAFVGAAADLGLDVIDLAPDLADAEMIVLISTSLAALTSKLAERFGAGAAVEAVESHPAAAAPEHAAVCRRRR